MDLNSNSFKEVKLESEIRRKYSASGGFLAENTVQSTNEKEEQITMTFLWSVLRPLHIIISIYRIAERIYTKFCTVHYSIV